MAALYRVKLNSEHFNMVRRYMVDKDMRSAATAAEEMIEIAAAASQAAPGQFDGEADAPGVAGDSPLDAGGAGRRGEAPCDGLAVDAAEHRRGAGRAQP